MTWSCPNRSPATLTTWAFYELAAKAAIRTLYFSTIKPARLSRLGQEVRPKIDHDALFVTKFRQPMGRRAVYRAVKKYLAEAGMNDASVTRCGIPSVPITWPGALISRPSRRRWCTLIFQLRPCTFHWPRKPSARLCRNTLCDRTECSVRREKLLGMAAAMIRG